MTDSAEFGAWVVLVDVYQAVLHDTVSVLEGEAGIDSGVYSALAYLERADPEGVMPLAELQARMYPRYSQSGFSRLVQRMERSGLVQRTKSPEDGRAATVTVTAAGRRRFRKAEALYVAAVEDAFGRHLDTRASGHVKKALEQVLARRADQLGAGSSVPK